MITNAHTAQPIVRTAPTRRTGLVAWLIRWNAAYREQARFARLDDAARRDMGLGDTSTDRITIAEIMARTAP